MALISMRQLLDHAAENNYGVPAFNVNNLEQIQAIMQSSDETSSPVIMQASAGARKYAGEPFLRQVDALAIAIGTSHGAYKFSRKPTGDILAIERIKAIHQRIPNTHLVMHGSSSVPQDWLKVIRDNCGEMKETYGVPVEEIQEGIKHGVRKINIDTDIRLAMTGAIRCAFNKDKTEFDPRKYLKDAMLAAKQICKARMEAFGTAGQAAKLKPIPLDSMAEKYVRGEIRAFVN